MRIPGWFGVPVGHLSEMVVRFDYDYIIYYIYRFLVTSCLEWIDFHMAMLSYNQCYALRKIRTTRMSRDIFNWFKGN